jgi:hypothetical protein
MSKKIKINSKYLIDDDSGSDDNNDVDWSICSKESDVLNLDGVEDLEEDDLEEYDILEEKKLVKNPEINIEIQKKGVKISINLEMPGKNKSNDIITIDFTINKETFLKIAKELK